MACYNLLTGQTLGWTLSNDCVLAKDISLTPERVIMRQEPMVTVKKVEFAIIFQTKASVSTMHIGQHRRPCVLHPENIPYAGKL
jgi:hypothetical protein